MTSFEGSFCDLNFLLSTSILLNFFFPFIDVGYFLFCQVLQYSRTIVLLKKLKPLKKPLFQKRRWSRSRFVNRDTAYSLRDSEGKVNVPLPRTKYDKNSFNYSGAVLWNSLSCEVRQAKSLKQFKQLINGIF